MSISVEGYILFCNVSLLHFMN
uniref:Uncharacterized protein n=1 Tax=Anguilla anguilla TaxID=7936 RepID=A0A0E9TP22_ANGAN